MIINQLQNFYRCWRQSFAFYSYGNAFCTFGDADDGLGAAVPSVVGVVAGIGTIAEVAGAEGKKYAAFYINGDFVLRRADGAWAYQLAVVVDDALMGITEVVRGRDLLLSAPQQIYLYRLLGFEVPTFCHLPLLCNLAGQRLCKRDKSLDLGEIRKAGHSPEEVIGKLAFYAGIIDHAEPVSAQDLVSEFSWEKVPLEDILVGPLFGGIED